MFVLTLGAISGHRAYGGKPTHTETFATMALQEDFASAQERVKTLRSRPSNETLLQLYGLYKQATEGEVQGKRPGMLDVKGRAKYDAWAGRKGLGREAAMQQYVALVDQLLKSG
jgi:diazepam-binding inhibitor (GABA receptor modulator, acyl-CoA-binding protein)